MDGKRKNFTDADDALLLKQTIADEPYKGGYGKIMGSSGITEEYELKHELLDEVLLLADEHRHTLAKSKEETRTTALAAEKAGEVVRELAIQRLKRRNPPGEEDTLRPSQSPNKFAKLAEVLREHKENELELRRELWDRLAAEAQRREDQQ
ncbi:unnamed protein product [Phytophthora fragariaefolia]|uniref:Unnamed protein product n=1 Tax=Phytophthora fragariaefolia TaxID=1490495 RepID=A0A9W7DBD6_9STRA|nr:unnamed protein product [Phytophthora fragariaefolia]